MGDAFTDKPDFIKDTIKFVEVLIEKIEDTNDLHSLKNLHGQFTVALELTNEKIDKLEVKDDITSVIAQINKRWDKMNTLDKDNVKSYLDGIKNLLDDNTTVDKQS